MKIATIIQQYGTQCIRKYTGSLLPSHYKALNAMLNCRTESSPLMKVRCSECEHEQYLPHSCGNRACPHCQHYEGQLWIEKQLQKKVPAEYFLLTFTIPRQLRRLFWFNQKVLYNLFFACVWETLQTFCKKDKQLGGIAGALMVLHTNTRALDYHPHIHMVMPAATLDKDNGLWREKKGFLFDHKALAKVFRAKMCEKMVNMGFWLTKNMPKKWVVDCKSVGEGEKAIIYLGRYLYRGVVQEKDILSCKTGLVTFRYIENKTGKEKTKTLAAEDFLWLVLQHTLPKGFRRARDFGYLHPNSKTLHILLQRILNLVITIFEPNKSRPKAICSCCGGEMSVIETRIKSKFQWQRPTQNEVLC